MNEAKQVDHTMILASPEAALGSPEVAHVIVRTLGRIGGFLKRAVIRATALVARFWRYLEVKSSEAAAIEKRVMAAMDERYRKNPYHVRGIRGLL